MIFDHSYKQSSAVTNSAQYTGLTFSPDLTRTPTFFKGDLSSGVEFREAISALHSVVVSNLKWKPKNRDEYQRWLRNQEQEFLVQALAERTEVSAQIKELQSDLTSLNKSISQMKQPFFKAQNEYYRYLYKKNYNLWFVLDPVITVHPDQIFFECFSDDESTYGKLSVKYDEFTNVGDFSCGTTNIDYSENLYNEFQKIRTYKTTSLEIDPSGFEVKTSGEDSFKEVKIDLPDSWVRGFLQVSSAMTLPSVQFELHPLDIYNFCLFLKKKKEKFGPRSMRYILKPGQPIQVLFEPWNITLDCPRSIYTGPEGTEIRVWGRRRLLMLERLIPVAKKFTVYLQGNGLPSFYVADLGSMSFTLGLSGWTNNDWSKCGNFDLMAPREEVDSTTKQRVFDALKENWFESPESLSSRLHLDRSTVLGALSSWTQAGRTIYDLENGVYRIRELSRDPLDMEKLRFENEREKRAHNFAINNKTTVSSKHIDDDRNIHIVGNVSDKSYNHNVSLMIDSDERIATATCDCSWHFSNKLRKGPCEHILALKICSSKQ